MKNTITTLAAHTGIDNDEIVGMTLYSHFGPRHYPIAPRVDIELWEEEPEEANPSTMYFGIGGSRLGPYDEHRQSGRLTGECCASLVAKDLKVAKMKNVAPVLEDALWCDTKPNVSMTQLPSIIKMLHRVRGYGDQVKTFNWGRDGVFAEIFGDFDDAYDIRKAWENFCADEKITPSDEAKSFVHMVHGRRKRVVSELASVCARMRPHIRQAWLPAFFNNLIRDCELFKKAVEEVNNIAVSFDVPMEKTDDEKNVTLGSEMMLVIESDNPHILKAASSLKTGKSAITVIRKSNGNTTIASNGHWGINLQDLAAMIRMAEFEAHTGQKLDYDSSEGQGTIMAVRNWYLPNGNLLLNGSWTHPNIPPTILTAEKIAEIAMQAFVQKKRDAWVLNYFT